MSKTRRYICTSQSLGYPLLQLLGGTHYFLGNGFKMFGDITPETWGNDSYFAEPTPWKINMEHSHRGLEDHFPF